MRLGFGLLTSLRNSSTARRRGMRLWGSSYSHHCATRARLAGVECDLCGSSPFIPLRSYCASAAEMARRNGGKGWGGARTRPRAGRTGLHVAVATLWAKGEGIRERILAMLGRLACWTGKGISGCNTGDRSRAAPSHANMPSTVRPAHRATLRSATAASPR
jgi:hypothetical protein